MLYDGALQKHGPDYAEPTYKVDMRSAMADLRFLQTFLYHLARARWDNVINDSSDLRVVDLAAELYPALGELADKIEKLLGPDPGQGKPSHRPG